MPNTAPTKISFCRKDSGLYGDEIVPLVDESHSALIRKLHDALARFQTPGVIREPHPKKLADTRYEQEYQQANARLAAKTWKTMDLDTAAFLIGFQGCLGEKELLALLPFFFEILLRAESWVGLFDLVVMGFRRKPREPLRFNAAYDEPPLRGLIKSALQSVSAKYANDPEFQLSRAATILERAIRDWT